MEFDVLKACLESKESCEKIIKFIELNQYSREFQHIIKFVIQYYQRDSNAKAVKKDLLLQQIAAVVENDKHIDTFTDFINRAFATESSGANVEQIIISAKKREYEIKLSIALAEGKADVTDLYQLYQSASSATTLEALGEADDIEVFEDIDVESLMVSRLSRDNLFPIYPSSVGDRVDGGIEEGDSMLIFGMTEIGKSLFSIHHACGWANTGRTGIYFINEDRAPRIIQRIVANLSGMDKYAMATDPARANRLAQERGLGNIRVIQAAPGSVPLIERMVEKYDPSWVVVDQLRNLTTATRNNRVIQLEEAATGMRNLGKKWGIVTVNVTQAGDSARDKLFLDTGDVDYSNVGIPGQTDLMYGIGTQDEYTRRGERGVSLCKNKISGDHAQVIVRVNPLLSKVASY